MTARIMGILNVTPDSFYDGGRHFDIDTAVQRAFAMKDEGADIIDVGGESTRPGAEPVSPAEEIDRVCPVIEKIVDTIGIPVSIDTYKSAVARAALESGASMVNDISGLTFDRDMAGVVAEFRPYVIIMHIKGTPGTMQVNPVYENLLFEIRTFLEEAAAKAEAEGIAREKIIIDPGIGFGKTLEDNYRIISNLEFFKEPGYPLCVGLSRKSLIGKLYGKETDRLPGTISLNTVSVLKGADIIRVHDVREHRLALDSLNMLKRVS